LGLLFLLLHYFSFYYCRSIFVLRL